MSDWPDGAAARKLAADWLAALEGADDEVATRFRYLLARVAERAGILQATGRSTRGGRRLVSFSDPLDGRVYEVVDPGLGTAEERLVDATEWILFGGRDTAG